MLKTRMTNVFVVLKLPLLPQITSEVSKFQIHFNHKWKTFRNYSSFMIIFDQLELFHYHLAHLRIVYAQVPFLSYPYFPVMTCFSFPFLTQAGLTPRRVVLPTVSHFTKLSPQPAINGNCWISICKTLQPWQDHLTDLWSWLRCQVGLPGPGSIPWYCKSVKTKEAGTGNPTSIISRSSRSSSA